MEPNDLISSLSSMFQNKESMEGISEMAKMLTPKNEEKKQPQDTFSEDMTKFMGKVISSFNRHDNRIDLLNSIRPYLRESRAGNLDMAIRVIKLLNVAKDFNVKDVKNVSDV